jgi:hypothetical protein
MPPLPTAVHLLLLASPSASPTSTGAPPDDTVSPGLLGFISFLFLGIAGYLIARGLTKQLKRVTFDEDAVNGTLPATPGAALAAESIETAEPGETTPGSGGTAAPGDDGASSTPAKHEPLADADPTPADPGSTSSV